MQRSAGTTLLNFVETILRYVSGHTINPIEHVEIKANVYFPVAGIETQAPSRIDVHSIIPTLISL